MYVKRGLDMAKSILKDGELLTVVVPVYNTSHYLSKCLESIMYQQYKNLDIILIDDGSTDGSGKICDEFSNIDNRIRVFHQKNMGLVATRKFGVELAKGDLITFVDSDDWIEFDMYYKMMAAYMEFEPDMVTSGITIENGDKVSYEIDIIPAGLYDHKKIKDQIVSCMMYDEHSRRRAVTPSVWNKIYKKDLFRKIIFNLDESITYGEDAAVTYIYIAKATRIMVLNKSWYHYVIHSDSMSRKYDIISFEKIYRFYTYMKAQFLEHDLWDKMDTQLKKYTKVFLNQTMQDVFDIIPENPIYLFPFELVGKDSRVVIYGAGKVGNSYRENLLKSGYAELIGFVDKNYNIIDAKEYIVDSPEILKCLTIDYVVIAIEKEELAIEIQDYIEKIGDKKCKIVWKPPVRMY